MRKKISQMEPWLGQEEQNSVSEYMKSGGWLTEFKKTKEFEKMIADYVGSKYCSVMTNGTLTLTAAIMALGLKKDEEVIVPDYTMIASANAVVLAGARPVLVDINSQNLCLDLELVKKAFTEKTKAIILVTINGRYPEVEKFVEFCKEKNIFLIEDAAQSLGSKYKGRHLGTFGVVGSFSLSMPKVITTGQGGALVTDDEEIYKKILKVKDFGREKAGVDYHEEMGYNFKFTDLQAVIGIEQMKKVKWRGQRKKEMAKLYYDLLQGIDGLELIETNFQNTSPWFIDVLTEPEKRESFVKFLEEKGVGSRPFYPAIHTQPPYSWVKGEFKNSEDISSRGLWLPSSSFLKDEDIEYICRSIKEFFTKS